MIQKKSEPTFIYTHTHIHIIVVSRHEKQNNDIQSIFKNRIEENFLEIKDLNLM